MHFRVIALLFLLLFSPCLLRNACGQKSLTLEDAVLKGRNELAPTNIKKLKWIPGETLAYSYITKKEEQEVLMMGMLEGKDKVLLTFEEFKAALPFKSMQSMRHFPAFKWENKDQFRFKYRGQYCSFDWRAKSAKIQLNAVPGAENLDYNPKQDALAFTQKNNLYVSFPNEKLATVTDFKDINIVCGKAIHRYEFGITKGTFWSPSGNYLAFYQMDETQVTDYPLVDISVKPARLKNTKYPMAGQPTHKAKVGVYHVKQNRTVYLNTGDSTDQYLTNLVWGPNERFIFLTVLNREQNHLWLRQYDAISGDYIRTLIEETDERYIEPEHPPYFLGKKKLSFLWWSERDGFQHLYQYDSKGELIKQITKGAWNVTKILGMDASGEAIIVEGTGKNPLEKHGYKVNLFSGEIVQLTSTPGQHTLELNEKGSHLFDRFSNTTTPGVVQLLDINGSKVKTLHRSENPLLDYNLGSASIFELKAKDQTPLYARLIKPHDFDPKKKYPVLVYVYGGPHVQLIQNRWLAGAPLWMYHAAEKGYLVFTLDNRGSKNRSIEFEQATFRALGKVELDDQLVGVEYLKKLPYVDTLKMAVHGWSFGGFMTTSLMLKAPGVFKVGVAGGPVINWELYEVMYTERYMDTPESNPEGYRATNLTHFANQLKGDLLLIHGTEDDIVLPQHSLSFLEKCVDENIPVDYFMYPGHGHNVVGKDRLHLMHKVLDYIDEKLGIAP